MFKRPPLSAEDITCLGSWFLALERVPSIVISNRCVWRGARLAWCELRKRCSRSHPPTLFSLPRPTSARFPKFVTTPVSGHNVPIASPHPRTTGILLIRSRCSHARTMISYLVFMLAELARGVSEAYPIKYPIVISGVLVFHTPH